MFMLQSKFKKWVNSEVEKKLDQQPFSSLPLRMRIGICLLISSFTIGYGVPIVELVISGSKNQLATGLLKGSVVYLASWVVGAIGLSLAGRDCIKYPVYFLAKFINMLFPNYFRGNNVPVRNGKEYLLLLKFHSLRLAALIGILIIIFLPSVFSSHRYLILGIIIIGCLHQIHYFYGMFSAGSNFFFKTVKGKEYFDHRNGILFRFDDGPDPVYTPQILDILKSEGLQALFAVTGKNTEMYPEIVARMHRENHIIANHTYSHPYNILFLSYNRIKNELIRTSIIIQSITGMQPTFFCSPMGHKNPIIGKAIKDLGLIPVMWDIRTLDTRAPFEGIMSTINRKIKSPSIIMFHDAITPWTKKDREATVLALKETIRVLKAKQYI